MAEMSKQLFTHMKSIEELEAENLTKEQHL